MSVKWGNSTSAKFSVRNGVKQGGLLSPRLFSIYMDDLSRILNDSPYGCRIGRNMINHISYADDMCLLSMSSAGMQAMLDICADYGNSHDIKYNATKSYAMCVLPVGMRDIKVSFSINNNNVPVVNECKYLVFNFY